MIVTIDGPAGSGKSTVARILANNLDFIHFDTGALYRAITWGLLQQQIAFEDEPAVSAFLTAADLELRPGQAIFLNQEEITQQIRYPQVNEQVSEVATLPAVREHLKTFQHELAQKGDSIFDGRDMGSVIFPSAEVKIFLTASAELRAQRRHQEMQQISLEEVQRNINQRDQTDSSRSLAPLRAAQDAIIIDSSSLSIEEVVEKITTIIEKKKKTL